MQGPLVFVDIDTQNDFLDPLGALYIKNSEVILPNLERLAKFAAHQKIPVLATACCHANDDPELKIFPSHCMQGTYGQERVRETMSLESVTLDLHERFAGTIPAHLTIYKNELDLFSRPDSNEIIAAYKDAGPIFVVYGVATDYCVKAAVNGLLARECKVAIVLDAIRAIDADAEPRLLTDFAKRGALLTRTETVCEEMG